MRGALGEVPDVALLELGDFELPVLVNGRDQDRAGVYITPFSLYWYQHSGSVGNGLRCADINVRLDANAARGSSPWLSAAVRSQCRDCWASR